MFAQWLFVHSLSIYPSSFLILNISFQFRIYFAYFYCKFVFCILYMITWLMVLFKNFTWSTCILSTHILIIMPPYTKANSLDVQTWLLAYKPEPKLWHSINRDKVDKIWRSGQKGTVHFLVYLQQNDSVVSYLRKTILSITHGIKINLQLTKFASQVGSWQSATKLWCTI